MHLEVTKKVLHSSGWKRSLRGIEDSIRLCALTVVQCLKVLRREFMWHPKGFFFTGTPVVQYLKVLRREFVWHPKGEFVWHPKGIWHPKGHPKGTQRAVTERCPRAF